MTSPAPRFCAQCGERVLRDTKTQSFIEKTSEPRAIYHLDCYAPRRERLKRPKP